MFIIGKMKGYVFAFLLLSCVFLLSGCGKPVGDISGQVSYKGKSLEFGSVTISSADGTYLAGDIQSDGTYLIKNVPVGLGKLAVTAVDPKQIEKNRAMVQAIREGHKLTENMRGQMDAKSYEILPKQYGDVNTAGLELEVKVGKNDFPISLK